DEAGLVAVAREDNVSFGLDVYAQEPLAADHPLRGLPNVTLTPHIGGPTTERRCHAGPFALKNLHAYADRHAKGAVITTGAYVLRQAERRHLVEPLAALMHPARADLPITGPASDHDAQADRLESFARPLLLAAHYLQSAPELPSGNISDPRAFRARLAAWF